VPREGATVLKPLDKSQNPDYVGVSRRTLLRGLGVGALAGATGVLRSSRAGAATNTAVETIACVVDEHGISFTKMKEPILRTGRAYRFEVTNEGWFFHRFAVRRSSGEPIGSIPVITPSTTKTLDLTFTEAGRYVLADGIGGDYPFFATRKVAVPIHVIR
jgi:hypothetical protein